MKGRADAIRFARARAGGRCEYCKMDQRLQGATFHLEHIVPRSRGGTSHSNNLAWACPSCNLHKCDRVKAVDPEDGKYVSIFNPRKHKWHDHFQWNGFRIFGKTAIGRATAMALDLNHSRRVRIRAMEESFGLFPGRGQ